MKAQTMKAQILKSFGGPESFELSDVAKPVPHAGQVLVRDGDGSYAEYHVASENIIGRKPASLTHLEAATLTLVGGTAWEALLGRVALRVGESILIHGGAGGVGHVAIQIAKAIGAKVFTTAREEQFEFARSVGADVVIDYEKEDYVDVIMRETGGHGVDVIFDTIGGDTLSRSPDALAQLGRVVSIVDIAKPQNLIEAWGKNASFHFVFTRHNRGAHMLGRSIRSPTFRSPMPGWKPATTASLAKSRLQLIHQLIPKVSVLNR